MSGNIGVERIFPVNLPAIEKIEVNKRGKVRRARIFYQRERTGKAARIKVLPELTIAALQKPYDGSLLCPVRSHYWPLGDFHHSPWNSV